jgi:3-oxoacyl-[acyl-carrier protein] reductase
LTDDPNTDAPRPAACRRLAGQVALVTGAGRGIGLSLALQLAAEGARLVVNDLDDEPARAAAEAIRAAGGEAIALPGSVTAADFPERLMGAALDAFGRIDILVNNAGYVWNGRLERMTDEQWDAMQDVHLKAPFRLARALAAHVASRRSGVDAADEPRFRRIVNVSSVSGTHGAAGQAAYAAAKAGIVGLTKSLARELGPVGVNVNGVAFGLIETRLTQEIRGETAIDVAGRVHRVGLTRAYLDDVRARIPLRRTGTPDEAAAATLLLCLPGAAYVTGQILEVDGGMSL